MSRELDELIHEKVMQQALQCPGVMKGIWEGDYYSYADGLDMQKICKKCTVCGATMNPYAEDTVHTAMIPKYSEDRNAAQLVTDKIYASLFSKRLFFLKRLHQRVCERKELPLTVVWEFIYFFITPMDICLTALEVYDVEVKE